MINHTQFRRSLLIAVFAIIIYFIQLQLKVDWSWFSSFNISNINSMTNITSNTNNERVPSNIFTRLFGLDKQIPIPVAPTTEEVERLAMEYQRVLEKNFELDPNNKKILEKESTPSPSTTPTAFKQIPHSHNSDVESEISKQSYGTDDEHSSIMKQNIAFDEQFMDAKPPQEEMFLGQDNSMKGHSPPPFEEQERMREDYLRILEANKDVEPPNFDEIKVSQPGYRKLSNFSIEDLPQPMTTSFGDHYSNAIINNIANSDKICHAAFGLDLFAIKHLLFVEGIDPNILRIDSMYLSAFHCLLSSFEFTSMNSAVALIDKNRFLELNYLLRPHELSNDLRSAHTRDVTNIFANMIVDITIWLMKAKVELETYDTFQHSTFHFAVVNGHLSFLTYILEGKSHHENVYYQELDDNMKLRLINKKDIENRTPVHFATIYGLIDILNLLVKHGGSLDEKDIHNVSPRDIISSPGPITPEDALKYFNIIQSPPRRIDRTSHGFILESELESTSKSELEAEVQLNGGWNTKILDGFDENDLSCDFDTYYDHEISSKDILEKYIYRNSPVLIRGILSHDWNKARVVYSKSNLLNLFGEMNVTASDIPYHESFGGKLHKSMTLREYIEFISSSNNDEILLEDKSTRWYVFKANVVLPPSFDPSMPDIDLNQTIVDYNFIPTPKKILDIFKSMSHHLENITDTSDERTRRLFSNVQWALGNAGTGAPVHYHSIAFNGLIYGRKKWIVYPPAHSIMSNLQILKYYHTDMQEFQKRGIHSRSCIQTAGDLFIVPEAWAHGVLNLQDSIAVAPELALNVFRISSGASSQLHVTERRIKQ